MGDFLRLNFANAFLPLAVLLVLPMTIPALAAGSTLSHFRLALAILAAGLLTWLAGAGIMAVLYAEVNPEMSGPIASHFKGSARLGLIWGPVLALVWLMRAQGVERRKGLLMREGRDEAAD